MLRPLVGCCYTDVALYAIARDNGRSRVASLDQQPREPRVETAFQFLSFAVTLETAGF